MPKLERDRLANELRHLESERRRLSRELHAHALPSGPEAVYMSAQILRHRISLALLRARLGIDVT